ncbi:MAG: ABC transporter permease, partial [Kiritimatiellae bacterium]|nr:ABC transporter permease [Kiritimatiellia bacterium]
EVSDGTLAHGSDLIGSMARVPFIFIAVVSLGFIAMIAASADARKKEFAALRAVGATRRQIAGVLAGEALSVALKGILYGTAAGSAAGWLFTFATRSAMSNWGIPPSFAFPFATIAAGAGVCVLSSLAVAVPAAACMVFRRREI